LTDEVASSNGDSGFTRLDRFGASETKPSGVDTPVKRSRQFAAAALLLSLLPFILVGCKTDLSDELPVQQAVDELLEEMTSMDGGGVAVAVNRGGEPVVRSSLGLTDRQRGTPMTTETPSYIASLSKPITALLILQLHNEDILSLDAPISRHLPDLPTSIGAVTARQLLTHQAGVPNWIKLAGGRTQCLKELAGTTNDDVVRMLIGHGRLDFEPETDAEYSNGGYVLLARLAEAASGSSMAALVEDRLATPLGLDATWVVTEDTPDPFLRAIGTKRNGTVCDYGLWTTGAGGIAASAEDLLVIGDAWQDAGLLPPELVEEAFSPTGPALSDDAVGHGLGWFVSERTQGRVVWHTGHYAGFVNVWVLAPEANLTIVVLSNGSISRATDIADRLLEHPDLQ